MFKKLEEKLLSLINLDRPIPIQIDITNSCNLSCANCYHSHHNNLGAVDLEFWQNTLVEYCNLLKKLRCQPFIIICGGEPFASPLLPQILDSIEAQFGKYVEIGVITNGTLLKDKDLSSLKKFSNLSLQISIDGPSAKEHNQLRGSGTFERTLAGIEAIRNHIPFILATVLSRQNVNQIASLFDLAKQLGASGIAFNRLIEVGSALQTQAQNSSASLLGKDLKEAFEKIVIESARTGVATSVDSPLMRLLSPALGANGRFDEGIVIDYQGYFLASSRSRIRIGSLKDSSLEALYFSNPIFKALRSKKIKVCGSCRLYDTCGGDRNAAYAHNGDYLGHDPGCWLDEISIEKAN